jgi:DNA replication licensing factor MCM5
MATGMDDFGIFFSDSLGGPGQNEGDLTMLKRRFREFLREFRDSNSAYIYRNELERAVTVKTNTITVELGDISAYDPSLAEQITKRPTTTFELLEEAAIQVADEVTRPRPGGEPIDPDLHIQV